MKLVFSDAQRHSYLKYGVRSVKGWLGTADTRIYSRSATNAAAPTSDFKAIIVLTAPEQVPTGHGAATIPDKSPCTNAGTLERFKRS